MSIKRSKSQYIGCDQSPIVGCSFHTLYVDLFLPIPYYNTKSSHRLSWHGCYVCVVWQDLSYIMTTGVVRKLALGWVIMKKTNFRIINRLLTIVKLIHPSIVCAPVILPQSIGPRINGNMDRRLLRQTCTCRILYVRCIQDLCKTNICKIHVNYSALTFDVEDDAMNNGIP